MPSRVHAGESEVKIFRPREAVAAVVGCGSAAVRDPNSMRSLPASLMPNPKTSPAPASRSRKSRVSSPRSRRIFATPGPHEVHVHGERGGGCRAGQAPLRAHGVLEAPAEAAVLLRHERRAGSRPRGARRGPRRRRRCRGRIRPRARARGRGGRRRAGCLASRSRRQTTPRARPVARGVDAAARGTVPRPGCASTHDRTRMTTRRDDERGEQPRQHDADGDAEPRREADERVPARPRCRSRSRRAAGRARPPRSRGRGRSSRSRPGRRASRAAG